MASNQGSNFFAQVTSTLDACLIDKDGLIYFAKCTGAPPTTASLFAHGALINRTDSGTGSDAVFQNVGSSAVPSWNALNRRKYTVTAMTTSATITTAAILGGMISANQGAAGAATYTMPTGTVLAAALPTSFTVGDYVEFCITNVSTVAAEDVTVDGATGTTLKGNGTVASNAAATDVSFGTFRAVNTGTNTFDVYRI